MINPRAIRLCKKHKTQPGLFMFSIVSNYSKNIRINLWTLKILDSHYEKKITQSEHIFAHFKYFFTCRYSKTVWPAENLNEIKTTHCEKTFCHIKQKFSHFVSLRLPLFSPRYITSKLNQKIITKMSNYLT